MAATKQRLGLTKLVGALAPYGQLFNADFPLDPQRIRRWSGSLDGQVCTYKLPLEQLERVVADEGLSKPARRAAARLWVWRGYQATLEANPERRGELWQWDQAHWLRRMAESPQLHPLIREAVFFESLAYCSFESALLDKGALRAAVAMISEATSEYALWSLLISVNEALAGHWRVLRFKADAFERTPFVHAEGRWWNNTIKSRLETLLLENPEVAASFERFARVEGRYGSLVMSKAVESMMPPGRKDGRAFPHPKRWDYPNDWMYLSRFCEVDSQQLWGSPQQLLELLDLRPSL
jgi:hypothetical protein